MKVARNNILEFLKIFRDLAGKSDSGHHGRRTRFPASSDRALTFQDCRSGYGGFKNHLGSTNGGWSRREGRRKRAAPADCVFSDDAFRAAPTTKVGLPRGFWAFWSCWWGRRCLEMAGNSRTVRQQLGKTSDARCSSHRRRLATKLVPKDRSRWVDEFGHLIRPKRWPDEGERTERRWGVKITVFRESRGQNWYSAKSQIWKWQPRPGFGIFILRPFKSLKILPNSDWAQILNISPKYSECTRCKISF